jgi:hypothetical protein
MEQGDKIVLNIYILPTHSKDSSNYRSYDQHGSDAIVTPNFKAKTGCSSYVCPGSRFHTYDQNFSKSDKTSVIIQSTFITIIEYHNVLLHPRLRYSSHGNMASLHMHLSGRNSN